MQGTGLETESETQLLEEVISDCPRLHQINRCFYYIFYLCNMKPKNRITEMDYIKAVKKADREFEIAEHGKQISMRGARTHKSKKAYDRNRMKRMPLY